MRNPRLQNNPLRTRADLGRACEDLVAPAWEHLRRDPDAGFFGDGEGHFKRRTGFFEALSRVCWGVGPLLASGLPSSVEAAGLRALVVAGTDPASERFWGDPLADYQLRIDAPGILVALTRNRAELWDPLDDAERERVAAWFGAGNGTRMNANNQVVFQLLVNGCLRELGTGLDDAGSVAACLGVVEEMHAGAGLYLDGTDPATAPLDFYNAWVSHFGLLLASTLCPDDPVVPAEPVRSRAAAFAPRYARWFAGDHTPVAFGRSLPYRFAMGSFWAGCAVAGVPDPSGWGVLRGRLLGHLRWWFQRRICTESGLLTAGYAYPNPRIGEQYTGPGSAYWALTAMAVLGLGDDHPFWTTPEEEPPGAPPEPLPGVPGVPLFVVHDPASEPPAATLYTAGAGPAFRGLGYPAKYDKFAYPSHAGFCVPLGGNGLDRAAPDGTLLLSEDGRRYAHKSEPLERAAGRGWVRTRWSPLPGVEVVSWIVPVGPRGHLRLHAIDSDRPLFLAEGGACLARCDALFDFLRAGASGLDAAPTAEELVGGHAGPGAAWLRAPGGFSGIAAPDPGATDTGVHVRVLPGSNLVHPNVLVPVLTGRLDTGRTRRLVFCAASPDPAAGTSAWERRPDAAAAEAALAALPAAAEVF